MFLYLKFGRAALMTLIKHDHVITVFYQPHIVGFLRSSRLCRSFAVDSKGNVHRYHAMRIARVIDAKTFGQHTAMGFVDVAKRDIRNGDIINLRVDLVVQIVIRVEGMNLM